MLLPIFFRSHLGKFMKVAVEIRQIFVPAGIGDFRDASVGIDQQLPRVANPNFIDETGKCSPRHALEVVAKGRLAHSDAPGDGFVIQRCSEVSEDKLVCPTDAFPRKLIQQGNKART